MANSLVHSTCSVLAINTLGTWAPLLFWMYLYLNYLFWWPWLILAEFCGAALHFAPSLPSLVFGDRVILQSTTSKLGPIEELFIPASLSFSKFPLAYSLYTCSFNSWSHLHPVKPSLYFYVAHKETQVQTITWKGGMKSISHRSLCSHRCVSHVYCCGQWLGIHTKRIIPIRCLLPKA